MKIGSFEVELFQSDRRTDWRMVKYEETNSRFWQFYEDA